MTPNTPTTRREFIRTSGRCAGLGGIAALLIAGELKRRRLSNSSDCIKLYTCADCVEFRGCTRSKAEEFRSVRI
ncbi:MAG: hypothetical protein ACXW3L_06800 [Limisphaerales bacterium]